MRSGPEAAPPGPDVPRPTARGKFLFVGERKLRVRGVTYGTFRPGRFGDAYPEPAIVQRDFGRMAAAGLNAIRTYTVPPEWLLDMAMEAGLRVLVGTAWEQHVAFLDEPGLCDAIEARVRAGVARCAGHPAILGYAVGNEIPAPIVRWSGRRAVEAHIRRLCDAARQVDPGGLVTYVNFPSTEYLDLPFLDLVAFNVYLESPQRLAAYLARLHHRAGERPLLLAELGLDSRRNGLERQARLLRAQIRLAMGAGCAGTFTFAWTDDWHRGGRDVVDWDFGLTTRDRRPKPALGAVSRAFSERLTPPSGRWPRVSVVVCAFNAERTLGECLRGLEGLDYPDYEVIVVDDGSTDGTAEIAARFEVELIRTENRGLSRARNTGIEVSSGELVAFIDADAHPDCDWLTHLALSFGHSDFVAVGGPNIAPHEPGRIASCVANAPGGPVHVLRTDLEAEHIPGCNMAFRRWALREVGGFDPRFRVAGDDVDLCWRIQERGWTIGFSPAAVVWHHPRDSVGAYWRQQVGYGAAEALLEAKWPDKYNVAGHVTWGGRVYGPGNVVFPGGQRIYGGTWGQAAYQLPEAPRPGPLWSAVAMPEWYLVLALLTVLAGLGLAWSPLLLALPALVLGVGVTVARAVAGGLAAIFPERGLARGERIRRRAIVAFLHLVQPAARLRGRFESGLVPWRSRARAQGFLWPRERRLRFWRWVDEGAPETLARLEARLDDTGSVVRRGGGYDDWDLEVEGGALGASRLRHCVEWYEERRQLLRIAVTPRVSGAAAAALVLVGVLSAWAMVDGETGVSLLLGLVEVGLAVRTLWECGRSQAALVDGARETVDGGVELDRPGREAPAGPREDGMEEARPAPAPAARLRASA